METKEYDIGKGRILIIQKQKNRQKKKYTKYFGFIQWGKNTSPEFLRSAKNEQTIWRALNQMQK